LVVAHWFGNTRAMGSETSEPGPTGWADPGKADEYLQRVGGLAPRQLGRSWVLRSA
jgi:hypothetical protein